MKFSVYLEQGGILHEMYQINRAASGVYFNPVYNASAVGPSKRRGQSLSYHDDGKMWTKQGRRRDTKWQRVPLREIDEPYTLSTIYTILIDPDNGRPMAEVNLRDEDIVFRRDGNVGVEVILSKSVPEFTDTADKLNSEVFVKNTEPKIIIEVFNTARNALIPDRFPPYGEPSVLGVNFFVDGEGRL